MALYKMFSVKDVKTGLFANPVMAVNLPAMQRMLHEVLSSGTHQFAKYPEDFVLYEIGEFDDQSGFIRPTEVPISLFVLNDLLAPAASA